MTRSSSPYSNRECTRGLAEAMPYLRKAKVAVVAGIDEDEVEEAATIGTGAVTHLNHPGTEATLRHSLS